MGVSPYPARRIPVDRSRSLPGAPRQPRTSAVIADPADRDDMRRAGHNPVGSDAAVWGRRVAAVTGRNSRKVKGWTSNLAGGEYVTAPGV